MFRSTALRPAFSTAALMLLVACSPPADETAVEQAETPTGEMPARAAEMDAALTSEARVYFIGVADGDVLSNPVVVNFGLDGIAVVPAGQDTPQSGHHHLIIDAPLPDMSLPIPNDANYLHFGDGSTSTELTLEPGKHTLQLLVGDFLHIPHDPAIKSEPITITVE